MIVCVYGLAGVGKTTWIKDNELFKEYLYINSDDFVKEQYEDDSVLEYICDICCTRISDDIPKILFSDNDKMMKVQNYFDEKLSKYIDTLEGDILLECASVLNTLHIIKKIDLFIHLTLHESDRLDRLMLRDGDKADYIYSYQSKHLKLNDASLPIIKIYNKGVKNGN